MAFCASTYLCGIDPKLFYFTLSLVIISYNIEGYRIGYKRNIVIDTWVCVQSVFTKKSCSNCSYWCYRDSLETQFLTEFPC